jgi:hypothetical protein
VKVLSFAMRIHAEAGLGGMPRRWFDAPPIVLILLESPVGASPYPDS